MSSADDLTGCGRSLESDQGYSILSVIDIFETCANKTKKLQRDRWDDTLNWHSEGALCRICRSLLRKQSIQSYVLLSGGEQRRREGAAPVRTKQWIKEIKHQVLIVSQRWRTKARRRPSGWCCIIKFCENSAQEKKETGCFCFIESPELALLSPGELNTTTQRLTRRKHNTILRKWDNKHTSMGHKWWWRENTFNMSWYITLRKNPAQYCLTVMCTRGVYMGYKAPCGSNVEKRVLKCPPWSQNVC